MSSTVATTGNNGSLWNSIKGNIKGVGDYFWIKLNNTNVKCRVAGRNIYKITGSEIVLITNHYVIVTDTPFQTAKMNSTDTTGISSNNSSSKGAFLGSDMWNTVLGANASTGNAVTTSGINNTLYSIFGSTLLTYIDLSTISIDTSVPPSGAPSWKNIAEGMGCSSGWGFHYCYATLLNECEVFGGPVFSSSGYDIGIKKAQLPLFSLNPELIILKNNPDTGDGKQIYWLKNVASGTRFCSCYSDGTATYRGASNSLGLRLEFLLSA